MLRWTLITFLTLPFCAVAGTDSYSCSVAQILELNKEGAFAKHEGIFKGLLGETFTIDRTTGKMFGLPFGTESYKSVTVLDKGSKDNSYKAIALSHEPNMWVMYVYVAEQQPGKKKPFWGTDDGNKIFSGICEQAANKLLNADAPDVAPVSSTLGAMESLREQLVSVALAWERAFGNAPQITTVLSEYDAARLIGCSTDTYSCAMQGITAVQKGHDFVFKGHRYQVKGNRPSGKPGSFVTWVPKATNYNWDYLIWVLYDSRYQIQEAWQWEVSAYRDAFDGIKRLSPAHLRLGKQLA